MSATSDFHEVRSSTAGPAGALETLLTVPASGDATHGIVVFSPSPLLGGDMENNVTAALARQAAHLGLAALRFNYRNAGRSDDDTRGRPRFEWWTERRQQADYAPVLDDGRAAMAQARALFEPIGVAGYSFGSWIALHMAAEDESLALAAVCPPLTRLDYGLLSRVGSRSLVILAGADELDPPGPEQDVRARIGTSSLHMLQDAGHFLLGEEERAVTPAVSFLTSGDGVSP